MHATLPLLQASDFPALRRGRLQTLQVNLGYVCNQSCLHCHVNAGPGRKEQMSAAMVDEVLAFVRRSEVTTLDLTGGAPELNPHFRRLVAQARSLGRQVIDRCNLSILSEPGQEGLAEFLAEHQVEIVASLPCYLQENVDTQRGAGTFDASISGLKKLNALGYGVPGSGLMLNLVYNPQGPSLPPPQQALEQDYKAHLREHYAIEFNHLFTITNMPIKRFGSTLISKGQFSEYMQLLKSSFSETNLAQVMCKTLISVDWQGFVYDCDFNQQLELPLRMAGGRSVHLRDLRADELIGHPIVVADHCYGCTAGQGSSCGGALN
ncbi:MAG: arsenosugar biosynthesis radical SAM protein ArsS [Gammaproteobacteria bacterium]|nr:arsenosugar biosynthesis radical SAM protein ArsS [Gammaproteobacteria bacterium]